MMDHSSQPSSLARLLDLNNQVHDLEKELLQEPIPIGPANLRGAGDSPSFSQIADIQEKIDRGGRASLVACWFGMPE